MDVDKRIGGGSFTTGFQWQWGDAENAINHWAELLTTKLSGWTSGTEIAQYLQSTRTNQENLLYDFKSGLFIYF